MTATVTLQLPDPIYQRLVNTATATGRSLEEIMLHALKVGSPPDWENVPDEFKADLATLDRWEDQALWQVATGHKTEEEMARHFELLERHQERTLTPAEQVELVELQSQADLFMLRKAHAAALLHWRGYHVPNTGVPVSTYIAESLKTQIREHDRHRCCYCLTSEARGSVVDILLQCNESF